jgi:hypothetical protein
MNVDCQSCGWSLEVPFGTGEGREFACGHCGHLLRNVEETRAFRWADVDPFVRSHGVNRAWFWIGAIAGFVWVPAIATALMMRHRFDVVFLSAIGGPWFAIEYWLARSRAAMPKARWYILLWIGVGAYAMYVAVIAAIVPPWRPFLGIGENPDALRLVFSLGVIAMMVGVAGASAYSWVLRRTPTARAAPPTSSDARLP